MIKKRQALTKPKQTKSEQTKSEQRVAEQTKSEPLDNFIFMNSWNEKKASLSFIELLCGKLLEYFIDKDKLCFEEFLVENQIASQTFANWTKTHDNLNDIYSHVKLILATRREKGMLKGEIREKPGMFTQHFYSEKWSEANKYWSELRKPEEEKDRKLTVIVSSLRDEADQPKLEDDEALHKEEN